METDKKKRLLKSSGKVLYILNIDKGSSITFKELQNRAEVYTGRKFVILQCPLPMPSSLFAMSFLPEKENIYVILYDKKLEGVDILLAVLHELGHILLGDLDTKKPFNESMIPEFFNNPQDPKFDEYVACRGLRNGMVETEQKPEFIARSLIRYLVSDGELSMNEAWSKMLSYGLGDYFEF